MRLVLMTWKDVEDYLRKKDLLIVPIGSTEQHGPNGLLGTDHLVAEALAWRLGEETETAVSPTLTLGMSNHHLAFPGTISLNPSTLIAVVRDLVLSLYAPGFRRFFFLNGHGGNEQSVGAAFSRILEEAPEAHLKILSWWKAEKVARMEEELFGDRNGWHASPSEISLTMHICPGAVTPLAGPLEIGDGPPEWPIASARFRECCPDGRVGSDPSLADPEKGDRIFRTCIAALSEEVRAFAGS